MVVTVQERADASAGKHVVCKLLANMKNNPPKRVFSARKTEEKHEGREHFSHSEIGSQLFAPPEADQIDQLSEEEHNKLGFPERKSDADRHASASK